MMSSAGPLVMNDNKHDNDNKSDNCKIIDSFHDEGLWMKRGRKQIDR